jgi:uncharacterized membrane protein
MTPNQRNAIACAAAFTWLVIGTIWLTQSKYYDHFCQRDLFNLSAVMVVIQWCVLVLSFILTCNISCRVSNSPPGALELDDSDAVRLLKD